MAAAMEAQAEAQAAEAARLAAVVEAAAAEAVRCEVAAALARQSTAPPSTVTFAAIKQLRERCPFADMKMCKEALRDHGCDIALAAEALEANRV